MRLNNGFEIPHIDTAQGYENESEVGQGIADRLFYSNLHTDWSPKIQEKLTETHYIR